MQFSTVVWLLQQGRHPVMMDVSSYIALYPVIGTDQSIVRIIIIDISSFINHTYC